MGIDKVADTRILVSQVETAEKRVTGLNGFFFKSNSKELVAWYGKHLGLKPMNTGLLWWKDQQGNDFFNKVVAFYMTLLIFAPAKTPIHTKLSC
jgi:hypothetical protein